MVVKDLLNLLFKYPVKGLVVVGGKEGDYTGIIRKEKIVELGTSNTHLGMELEENLGKLMIDFNAMVLKGIFDVQDVSLNVPVIDLKGNFLRVESPNNFLKWIEQQEERTRALHAAETAATVRKAEEATKKKVPEIPAGTQMSPPAESGYVVLNQLFIPVLVTNPAQLIIFANSYFLNSFNVEKDFILHQKMSLFLPKVRLENNLAGMFTYQHKKWNYRVNYQADRIFIVFSEVHIQKQDGYQTDLERMSRDKTDLRTMAEGYENWIIKKIHQKNKQNIRQTAQVLKIPEETLKYRLHKLK